MIPNDVMENNFESEKTNLISFQSSIKSKTSFVTLPSSYPFVNEIKNLKDLAKINHTKKTNKVKYFKYIASIILIIYLILYFDFDDIQPYKIIQDIHYKAILEEIPKINNETFKLVEFNITKTYLSYNIINKFNSYIEKCMSNKLIDNKSYPLLLTHNSVN